MTSHHDAAPGCPLRRLARGLLLLAGLPLAACALPPPQADGSPPQAELQSMAQWDALVIPMAQRLAEARAMAGDDTPLFIEPVDEATPFPAHVRTLLVRELSARGVYLVPRLALAQTRLHIGVEALVHRQLRVVRTEDVSSPPQDNALTFRSGEVALTLSLVRGSDLLYSETKTAPVAAEALALYAPGTPQSPLMRADAGLMEPPPRLRSFPIKGARR